MVQFLVMIWCLQFSLWEGLSIKFVGIKLCMLFPSWPLNVCRIFSDVLFSILDIVNLCLILFFVTLVIGLYTLLIFIKNKVLVSMILIYFINFLSLFFLFSCSIFHFLFLFTSLKWKLRFLMWNYSLTEKYISCYEYPSKKCFRCIPQILVFLYIVFTFIQFKTCSNFSCSFFLCSWIRSVFIIFKYLAIL